MHPSRCGKLLPFVQNRSHQQAVAIVATTSTGHAESILWACARKGLAFA
jgi:hypothetical protein